MPTSDAFVVGEDFVSEHFFSSDASNESFRKFVLDRRKAWDAAGNATSRSRFTAVRGDLATRLAALYSNGGADGGLLGETYAELRRVLGYQTGEFLTRTSGPISWFNTAGVTADAPLAVVEARPAAAVEDVFAKADEGPLRLREPWQVDEKTVETSVTRAVSRLFNSVEHPEFVLVLAGRWALVSEQGRWAEGRYLAVDLQTVCDRNDTRRDGEIDRALTILDAESLAPDADGQVWWKSVLEASVKHTVGVSQDLREGVRRSIEIIANEVVARRSAQGLEPLPAEQAQLLARQSLRFLYRILFLLYAEASPELGVLPVGTTEYDTGYSLDRLRELTLVELASPTAQAGTHLYDSLAVLFTLVDRGHRPDAALPFGEDESTEGLVFHALRADLFKPEAIELISQTRLGNRALQQVLRYLLLSKEQAGRERGFISYVDLGINQLGAVYEGLMSYTGFFATEDLYEVARAGNPEKGSWVVPVDRAQGIAASDFVREQDPITGEQRPVVHERGQFVFRLSGRARQQSASYYTPEVLTQFTVGQALEELLDQDGTTTTAEEILGLTVCEPALGSGAFAIEAVRQLAEQYLTRREKELGEKIAPEEFQTELQRVKAYLALHNVYGVDLNATAVEFAEITLWLATMAKGLTAPWFGLHLRRGNSLIGARRAVYTRDDVTSRAWRSQPPTDVPLADLALRVAEDSVGGTDVAGRIHHFLLPAAGWGSTADSKEAKELVPERVARVKEWRKQFNAKPTTRQLNLLVDIAAQAEELWTMALRRLMVAEQQTRREIPLWGREVVDAGSTVTREQIEESLADVNGAYQRLKRVMDAWCALWFWPLTGDEVAPPSWAEWVSALQEIIGAEPKLRSDKKRWADDLMMAPADVWESLADQESFVLAGANAQPIAEVLERHPWLRVCERVAGEQGFFHWELEFAPVFGRGGFDLQVGNPPWVRPRGDVAALLAEGDPWWQLTDKPSTVEAALHREIALGRDGVSELVVDADAATVGLAAFVGDVTNYPVLSGLQPDLYRCFMAATWGHGSSRGTVGLLHPETHFTDEKAGTLRAATYPRLRRHWQFVNELQLFGEIDHHVSYGVHIYGRPSATRFQQASGLYHPETALRSLRHDGDGAAPGIKHDGHWDLRPHAQRVELVDDQVLAVWRDILDPELANPRETRMVYTVNREVAEALEQLARGDRLGGLGLNFSRGWDESIDRKKGYFVQRWGVPHSWDDVILQGPHLHVGTPLYKQPNQTMKHNLDWSETDFETLAPDAIPATSYKPAGDRGRYDRDYTHWDGVPARNQYRLAWRNMAANTGERTLISALIPPGSAHVDAVFSAAAIDAPTLVATAASSAGLLSDFAIRVAPKAHIRAPQLERLPRLPAGHPLLQGVYLRTLRLNCVTDAYADLWRGCWSDEFTQDAWTSTDHVFTDLGDIAKEWSASTPLRRAADRRQALVEIDALVALMLGVTADQLCTVYRTQFAVLYGYDHDQYTYDANGRVVPNPVLVAWRKKGDRISLEERTHTNQAGNTYVYELPFGTYDREHDMRVAYAEFEHRLQNLRETSGEPSLPRGAAERPQPAESP